MQDIGPPLSPPRKTGAILEGRKVFEKGPEKTISSGKSFIFSTFPSGNDRNSPPEADTPADHTVWEPDLRSGKAWI